MALATAAKLARAGWCQENVRYLIEAIAFEARIHAQGRPITGEERFIELLGLKKAENIQKWVLPQNSSVRSKPSPSDENVGSIRNFSCDLTSDAGAADAFTANFKDELVWCGGNDWYFRKKEVFEPVCFELVQAR